SEGGESAALVYGIESNWQLADRHALQVGVEQRQPTGPSGSRTLGTSLGWTYYSHEAESRLSLDWHEGEAASKRALQWQGMLRLGDRGGLRGEALWTNDTPGGTLVRLSMSGAYRTRSLVVLGSITGVRRITDS